MTTNVAWTLEDSSKLQQVCDVITQIKEEMKPLAKLEGTSARFLFPNLSFTSLSQYNPISG